ncbi:hypothetical protein B0H15DRAFT_286440, partial [Mycena belliarum]
PSSPGEFLRLSVLNFVCPNNQFVCLWKLNRVRSVCASRFSAALPTSSAPAIHMLDRLTGNLSSASPASTSFLPSDDRPRRAHDTESLPTRGPGLAIMMMLILLGVVCLTVVLLIIVRCRRAPRRDPVAEGLQRALLAREIEHGERELMLGRPLTWAPVPAPPPPYVPPPTYTRARTHVRLHSDYAEMPLREMSGDLR